MNIKTQGAIARCAVNAAAVECGLPLPQLLAMGFPAGACMATTGCCGGLIHVTAVNMLRAAVLASALYFVAFRKEPVKLPRQLRRAAAARKYPPSAALVVFVNQPPR